MSIKKTVKSEKRTAGFRPANKTKMSANRFGKAGESMSEFDNAKSSAKPVKWGDKALQMGDKVFLNKDWKDGEVRRIFILSDEPVMTRAHYIDGKGYYECLSEYTRKNDHILMSKQGICCQNLLPAKAKYGLVVAWFDTDKEGKTKESGANVGYQLAIWTINQRQYDSLSRLQNEWNFSEHDLLVTCADATFLSMEFQITKNSLLENKALKQDIETAFDAYEYKNVSRFLARAATEEDYEKLFEA